MGNSTVDTLKGQSEGKMTTSNKKSYADIIMEELSSLDEKIKHLEVAVKVLNDNGCAQRDTDNNKAHVKGIRIDRQGNKNNNCLSFALRGDVSQEFTNSSPLDGQGMAKNPDEIVQLANTGSLSDGTVFAETGKTSCVEVKLVGYSVPGVGYPNIDQGDYFTSIICSTINHYAIQLPSGCMLETTPGYGIWCTPPSHHLMEDVMGDKVAEAREANIKLDINDEEVIQKYKNEEIENNQPFHAKLLAESLTGLTENQVGVVDRLLKAALTLVKEKELTDQYEKEVKVAFPLIKSQNDQSATDSSQLFNPNE